MLMKGFIDWMIVKSSILVLGAVLLVLLLSLVSFHFYFAKQDRASKTLMNIALVVDSVCASPYNISTEFEASGDSLSCDNETLIMQYSANGISGRKKVLCCFSGSPRHFSKIRITKRLTDGNSEVTVVGLA